MNRNNKKDKSKNKSKEKLNNLKTPEDIIEESSISIIDNDNKIIIDEEKNKKVNNEEQDEYDIEKDKFEQDLRLMDENHKKGLSFLTDYEPHFSINCPNLKIGTFPMFTPSTKLNKALQLEDKNDCLIFYYTHKKTLYPTIYSQLIGISGPRKIFTAKELNERDFIWAGAKSIIFTNQKNFINLNVLINEYILPLLEQYKKNEEEKNIFIDELCNNILIQEYLTYEELLLKVYEINTLLTEYKISNIGLIIIDGINSINPQKLEFVNTEDGKNYRLKFYKFNTSYKAEQNSNKKNNRNSYGNKRGKSVDSDYYAIRQNLYGYITIYMIY